MTVKRPPHTAWKARTYQLTEELIDRVTILSNQYQVGPSDMARYLLDLALTAVESGKVTVPVRQLTDFIIDKKW